jgi:hypothetical protein
MQVTAVGLNTEWGLLMASISEDNNEETPLQVFPLFYPYADDMIVNYFKQLMCNLILNSWPSLFC